MKSDSTKLADEMLSSFKEGSAQRDEIRAAFISKFGFEPDECKQVRKKDQWLIVRLDPKEVGKIRRSIVQDMFYKQGPNWWQRFCLWMARLK